MNLSPSADLGHFVARYGLVLVFAWVGFGKYVKKESRTVEIVAELAMAGAHPLPQNTFKVDLGRHAVVRARTLAAVDRGPKTKPGPKTNPSSPKTFS